jgi:putative ABC transport system permease protein
MTDHRPPAAADRLLRRMLPRGVRGDTIRGDLLEEFRANRSRLWYWRQVWSLACRYGFRSEAKTERRRPEMIETIWHDVRYAARSYAKTPTFTLAVLTTLALGIGASTAIFSMVNGILLRPLPLNDPDTLVYANEVNPKLQRISTSWLNYLDWRQRARSFEHLALTREEAQALSGVDRPQRLRGRRVTGNFFRALGVQPVLGRSFTDDDDRAGAPPVALITDGFWRAQFGADPAIVGRSVILNEAPTTVVGVLPRRFEFLRPYDVFISVGSVSGSPMLMQRGNHNGFYAVGRLRAGVAIDAADHELQGIAAQLEREHADTNTGISVRAEPLADRLVADVRPTLLALLGAVGFLLLIACVNVANLLIARGAARQHELAVRAALGSGRRRLIAQLLVESTLLSMIGGACGVAAAWWLLRALVAVAPVATPRLASVALDGSALLFAFAASTICGLVFGAFPALLASGIHGQHALIRGRAAGFAAGSHRLRRGLMVAETALAVILLAGAGLMMRTLQRLADVETGFRPDHLMTAQFVLTGERWTDDRQRAFRDELLARARAVPGVTRAALTFVLPIDGSQWNSILIVSGKPVPDRAHLPNAAFTPVSDGYFETVGMRLVRGRTFEAQDSAEKPRVAVVNESFARAMWPGEDPIGKRLKQGWPEDAGKWTEVVGVAGDVKFNGIAEETPMQVYLPLNQVSMTYMALVARTGADPATVMPALEAIVHDLDKDLPLYGKRTMEQIIDSSMAQQRVSMMVFVVFAVVAVTLAAVGLYGVVAHGVTERTHEIGVRMALGADPGHVLRLIVGQGLVTVGAGLAVGVAGALLLSRTIESLLFGITRTDPATFAAVVALLLGVGLAACGLPAWRATRVDPTAALRAE